MSSFSTPLQQSPSTSSDQAVLDEVIDEHQIDLLMDRHDDGDDMNMSSSSLSADSSFSSIVDLSPMDSSSSRLAIAQLPSFVPEDQDEDSRLTERWRRQAEAELERARSHSNTITASYRRDPYASPLTDAMLIRSRQSSEHPTDDNTNMQSNPATGSSTAESAVRDTGPPEARLGLLHSLIQRQRREPTHVPSTTLPLNLTWDSSPIDYTFEPRPMSYPTATSPSNSSGRRDAGEELEDTGITPPPNVNPFVMRNRIDSRRASVIQRAAHNSGAALTSSRSSPIMSARSTSDSPSGTVHPRRAVEEYLRRGGYRPHPERERRPMPRFHSYTGDMEGMSVSGGGGVIAHTAADSGSRQTTGDASIYQSYFPAVRSPAVFTMEGMLVWPDSVNPVSTSASPAAASRAEERRQPLDDLLPRVCGRMREERSHSSSAPDNVLNDPLPPMPSLEDFLAEDMDDFESRFPTGTPPPRPSASDSALDLFAAASSLPAAAAAPPVAAVNTTPSVPDVPLVPFHRRMHIWHSAHEMAGRAENPIAAAPPLAQSLNLSSRLHHSSGDSRVMYSDAVRRRELRQSASPFARQSSSHSLLNDRRSRDNNTQPQNSFNDNPYVAPTTFMDWYHGGGRDALEQRPSSATISAPLNANNLLQVYPQNLYTPVNTSSSPASPEIQRNHFRQRILNSQRTFADYHQGQMALERNVRGEDRLPVDRAMAMRVARQNMAQPQARHEALRMMHDQDAERRRRLVYIPQAHTGGGGGMGGAFTAASWFHFVDGASAIFMHADGEPKLILEEDVVAAIQVDTESIVFSGQFAATDECIICFEEYENGQDVRVLSCNNTHRFHRVCIDKWLIKNKPNCPICRRLLPSLKLPRDHTASSTSLFSSPNINQSAGTSSSASSTAVLAPNQPTSTYNVADLFL